MELHFETLGFLDINHVLFLSFASASLSTSHPWEALDEGEQQKLRPAGTEERGLQLQPWASFIKDHRSELLQSLSEETVIWKRRRRKGYILLQLPWQIPHTHCLINISLLFQEKLLKDYISQQLWGRDVSFWEIGGMSALAAKRPTAASLLKCAHRHPKSQSCRSQLLIC